MKILHKKENITKITHYFCYLIIHFLLNVTSLLLHDFKIKIFCKPLNCNIILTLQKSCNTIIYLKMYFFYF